MAATYIYIGSLISFTKSLYWYSSFLNTTIIVIGTWFLYEEYRWKIEHPTPPLNENSIKSGTNGLGKVLNKSNEDRNLSVRVMYASASDINRNENKTVYLTHSTSTNALDNSKLLVPNPDFQLTAAPTISPKLKNPIKGNSSGSVTRNKQKHTTGKNARNVSGTSNTSSLYYFTLNITLVSYKNILYLDFQINLNDKHRVKLQVKLHKKRENARHRIVMIRNKNVEIVKL